MQHLMKFYLILLAIAPFVQVLGYWVASKALAERDKATVGNAFLLWFYYLIFGVVVAVAMIIVLPIVFGLSRNEPQRAWIAGAGTLLTIFLCIFLIPMKLYVIGFFRSVLFVILAIVVYLTAIPGVGAVVAVALGANRDIAALQAVIMKPGRNPQQFMQRLAGQEAPDEIDRLLDEALDPIGPQTLADRETAVRILQQKLQERSRTFQPGAPPPAAYQNQLKRYLQLLDEVKAEKASSANQPAATESSRAPSKATTAFAHGWIQFANAMPC